MFHSRLRPIWLILALLLFAGCSDFIDATQPDNSAGLSGPVTAVQTVGQTFVARHAGLNGIQVWLALQGLPGDGTAVLHLRDGPASSRDLASASVRLSELTQPGYRTFAFPPLSQSNGRSLYFAIEAHNLPDGAALTVGRGRGEAYLDGAMYREGEPRDRQITFRLQYEPGYILLDLAQWTIMALGVGLAATALFVLPGWALLVWLAPKEQLPWAARLGIAAGLSLAVYPLLLLWTDLVGLHLGPLYAWLPVALGLAALAWRYRAWRPQSGWKALQLWARSEALWPDMALLAVTSLVFGVRLVLVRALDAPMWGDSYQHTMIAQLMVDHGGLFTLWEPYAPLQSFTYHFGFHSAVAAFHWLTGLGILEATIWVGQILNGLAVLTLYPLALRVSGSRWAGVGAVLLAGLFSPMPMYYVNWGRYTQLAGQTILPAAVLISWSALQASRRDWRLAILSWIAVGGLALTHYRVLIFYVIFVVAWVLLCSRWDVSWQRALSRLTLVGLGAAVLFAPWLTHTFVGEIVHSLGRKLSTGANQLSSFDLEYNAIGDLSFYLPYVWWLALLAAVAVGLWQRRREILLVCLWWFLLLIATNPAWIRFPGSGAISNLALFIAAYILAGVLVGDLWGQLMSRFRPSWWGALATVCVVGAGMAGAQARTRDVQITQHALVTRPDLRAMAWVRENTPQDARFLVNSFTAYGGSSTVGSDGGWWLPLIANRANTVPPLTYGMEQEPYPNYRRQVNALNAEIRDKGPDHPDVLTLLREHGITHVYIGQQQGRVNYGGPDTLNPELLLASPHFRSIYHQDRVWVFELAQ